MFSENIESVDQFIEDLVLDHLRFSDPVPLNDLRAIGSSKIVVVRHIDGIQTKKNVILRSDRYVVHIGNLRIMPGTEFGLTMIEYGKWLDHVHSKEIIVYE